MDWRKDIAKANFPYEQQHGMDLKPTLSYLIRACGDGFSSLVRHGKGSYYVEFEGVKPFWMAIPQMEPDLPPSKTPEFPRGKTPEEAVARLWLQLQVN